MSAKVYKGMHLRTRTSIYNHRLTYFSEGHTQDNSEGQQDKSVDQE
jgi:hypothetical protein